MSFRLLRYVLNRRRAVFWVTLFFFTASLVFVIFTDRMYESRALLMPPLEEGGGILVAWLAQLNIPATSLPVSAGSTSAAILADILRSRRMGEYVALTLDLRERYGEDGMENTLRDLWGRTGITVTTTGLINLSVRDEDPVFAARIANEYIAGLDSINRYLEYTRAEQTRVFVSKQIERYRGELSRLQGRISRFQEEHGIIHFEEQVRGAIDVAANLKLKTTMARIEWDLMREFQRDDAIELMRKETEYENLNRQLEIMMEGDTSNAVFFPLRDMPALYQEYAAMERDLEVTERVYSYLLQIYEQAGVDRARNTPSVQVVDEPSIPEEYAGLPLWSIPVISALVGFLWSSLVLAWWGWLTMRRRADDEETAFREVGELFRSDLDKLRRWLRI
jgi:tyrosine-protein kinase Etk/Wzc